jgi:hypothetical protein
LWTRSTTPSAGDGDWNALRALSSLRSEWLYRRVAAADVVKGNLEAMPFGVEEYLEGELPEKVDPDWGDQDSRGAP